MKKIPACHFCAPISGNIASNVRPAGSYRRQESGVRVQRWRCYDCKSHFSDATNTLEFRQKKRLINLPVFWDLASLTSLRRAALKHSVHRKTVVHRLGYFAKAADRHHEVFLRSRKPSSHLQFDDMESSEHTKLKPLSMPMIVDQKTREVLAFDVVRMPAKGPLAALSRRKYGRRVDLRPMGWKSVLTTARRTCMENVTITSDSHNRYPAMIQLHMPSAKHIQVKGRKACVAGQGELKRGGRDPLYSFNHTAAMFRANVNRLIRKTWCTTKRPDQLRAHMSLFVLWHNEVIAAKTEGRKITFPF